MNEAQRHKAILSLLNARGSITVQMIIDNFGVSPATARRDIAKLDEQKKLIKIRNGAERINNKAQDDWSPLSTELFSDNQSLDEKALIAVEAATLVEQGDSVVINCGSTAFLLGHELAGQDIQIVTNYYPLARYLIEQGHNDLVITGGQYNKEKSIFLNTVSEVLSNYSVQWMFTSGKGLTEEGLYKNDMITAVSEQQMLKHISKLVAVVDSSKINQKAGFLFCNATEIDYLITGKNADQNTIKALEQQGVEIILV